MPKMKSNDTDRAIESALASFVSNLADSIDPLTSDGGIWGPNEGPQTMAYETLADETFYGGAAGGGKFVKYFTNVLTPFGWKLSQDVKVGDALVAHDGTATKVLAIYPHKNREMYRITFVDGASIEVSDDHVWMYWYASKKIKADRKYVLYDPVKGIHTESVRGRLGLTKDLYEYHKKQEELEKNGKRPYWILTPLCEPVQFTRPSRTRQGDVIRINPYLLGLLIGDGTITGNSTLQITTIDEFIVEEVKRIVGDDSKFDGKKNIRINGESRKEIEKQLASYGLLGCKSATKFIPENYLYASLDVRFDLIAGLVDTDGYIDDRGHISYTTISEQLAKDVQQLARSLGAKATITKGPAGYKNDEGEYIQCNDAYTVYMMGKFKHMKRFAKLPRKKNRIKPFNGGYSEIGRRITSIEKIENGDGVCFAIDHPTGLHVVQDFIVTHNSDLLLGWALTRGYRSIIYRREYPQLKAIIARSKLLLQDTGATYNGQNFQWLNIPGGRTLEFGSVPHVDSVQKYQGRPYDFIGFDEVTNFCLPPEAEVLTKSGFKFISEVVIGEEVLSIDMDKKISYNQVTATPVFDYDSEMIHIKSKLVDVLATPNHKILLQRQYKDKWYLSEMKDMPTYPILPFYGEWDNDDVEEVEIPSVSGRGLGVNQNSFDRISGDDYVEFMGWYLSEGSCQKKKPRVSIAQKKPNVSLKSLLDRLPFKVNRYDDIQYLICSRQLYEHLKPLGNTYTKRVPDWIKNASKRQLKIFFDAFVAGDGHRLKNGGIAIGLANEGLIDDLQEIATKLGLRSYKYHKLVRDKFNAYYLSIYRESYKQTYVEKDQIYREHYAGKIHCLTVEPNHIFLVRYNGRLFWSGNSESQYIFLTTWNRTEMKNVRTRIIGAGNPPTTVDGEWVIRRWAAWLDPQHNNPAVPGELRWYAMLDDKEEEFEDNKPIEFKQETIYPTSRTFIAASLENNPYYGAEYKARLQSLPPELRSKFLYGDFGLVFEDDPWQVIPSAFIKAGKERWRALKDANKLEELTNVNPAYGLDPAEAGEDLSALCKLNVNVVQWIKYFEDPDLMKLSEWTVAMMIGHQSAPLGLDANGLGAGVFYRMKQLNYRAIGLKTQSKVSFRDRTGNMQFLNLRSYLWWLLRDALDPYGNIKLAIPDNDQRLERELIAPRWRLTESGLVQVDSKDVLRERLGRSTDSADALMLALYVSHVRRPPMRMV